MKVQIAAEVPDASVLSLDTCGASVISNIHNANTAVRVPSELILQNIWSESMGPSTLFPQIA
jgi:hypothetical protein